MVLDLAYKLRDPIKGKIKEQGMDKLYYEVELPLVEVLAHMEFNGFKVDLEVLNQLGRILKEKLIN